jgi:hypothetical protein
MRLNLICTQHRGTGAIIRKQITIENINEDSYLFDILKETGYMLYDIVFPEYYKRCDERVVYNHYLPFILKDGKFHWSVSLDEVTVGDFLSTHCIKEDEFLCVYTTETGGFGGDEEIINLWLKIYPYLTAASVFITVFQGISGFIKAIKNAFGSKIHDSKDDIVPYPSTVFTAIFTRDYWILNELAEALNMEPEQARCWLKALGYKWSNTDHCYIITQAEKEKFWEEINNIR